MPALRSHGWFERICCLMLPTSRRMAARRCVLRSIFPIETRFAFLPLFVHSRYIHKDITTVRGSDGGISQREGCLDQDRLASRRSSAHETAFRKRLEKMWWPVTPLRVEAPAGSATFCALRFRLCTSSRCARSRLRHIKKIVGPRNNLPARPISPSETMSVLGRAMGDPPASVASAGGRTLGTDCKVRPLQILLCAWPRPGVTRLTDVLSNSAVDFSGSVEC